MYKHFGKRVLDVVLSVTALAVLSPALLLLAVMIRLKLGSPVLFRQERPGLGGRPFTMYKFRTMAVAAPEATSATDAQRLTPFGTFLRRASVDEFPEMINVLRGEMSLVGPRPLLMHYLPRYSKEQFRRHEALPGITGWAQVNGRNAISWPKKFALDVWYVDHLGLLLDLRILALTVLRVVCPQGISAHGHATMPEFTGKERDEA